MFATAVYVGIAGVFAAVVMGSSGVVMMSWPGTRAAAWARVVAPVSTIVMFVLMAVFVTAVGLDQLWR